MWEEVFEQERKSLSTLRRLISIYMLPLILHVEN